MYRTLSTLKSKTHPTLTVRLAWNVSRENSCCRNFRFYLFKLTPEWADSADPEWCQEEIASLI